MLEIGMIKEWARSPNGSDRYLRPFVARGPLQRRSAAVVGLNPATAIGPTDIPFADYVDLLLDLDAFNEFYRGLRVGRGKRATSPTRTGLKGVAAWLAQLGWQSVVETNISPYPTENSEQLRKTPGHLQSRAIFREVMNSLAPRIIILHGEEALAEFTSYVAPELAPPAGTAFLSLTEQSAHLGQMEWPSGEACDVFVCRHLRFFGHTGGVRFAALENALNHVAYHG